MPTPQLGIYGTPQGEYKWRNRYCSFSLKKAYVAPARPSPSHL